MVARVVPALLFFRIDRRYGLGEVAVVKPPADWGCRTWLCRGCSNNGEEVSTVVVVENSTVSSSRLSKWRFEPRRDRSKPASDISESSRSAIVGLLVMFSSGRRVFLVDVAFNLWRRLGFSRQCLGLVWRGWVLEVGMSVWE